jgi:hypothetical protein
MLTWAVGVISERLNVCCVWLPSLAGLVDPPQHGATGARKPIANLPWYVLRYTRLAPYVAAVDDWITRKKSLPSFHTGVFISSCA